MRRAGELLLFLSLTGLAPAALATVDYGVGPGDLILSGSVHAAAGQAIGVTRTIHNLQGASPPCPYSYFLNPPTVFLEGNGVPVPILSDGPSSGLTYLGTTPSLGAYGEPSANDTAIDQILIPDGVPPGTYNLVLVIDPSQQVADADPSNNATWVAIRLTANPLQIASPSALPVAIVGAPYRYALTEQGGGTQSMWSLLAGALPNGISLDSLGELSGTPTEAGLFDIVVQVASGGDTQTAVLELPVVTSAGPLSIEQSGPELPPATAGAPYILQFIAEGGVPPYSWKGMLPQQFGMLLSPGGVLAGAPLEASDGPLQFTVVVTDSIGTQATAIMTLQILSPSELTITTPFLQPAVVGETYDLAILASDGLLAGLVFNWSLSPSTPLPGGIEFMQIGNPAVANLSGIPTQAGIFPLVVNVSDNFGHSTMRQYILTVTGVAAPEPPPPPNPVVAPPPKSGGCATGDGPTGTGLLLLAMVWLARRRRRWMQVARGFMLAAVGVVLLFAPAAFAALTIETVSLPAGSTGQLYNFSISAVGGVPPYRWALVTGAGTPPPGISLAANGTLTGEPKYDVSSNFKVSVTDSTGTTVTSPSYTLTIFAAGSLAVASTTLEPAILGQTFNDTLHAAGGTPPYTWQLISVFREPAYPGDPGENLGTTGFTSGLPSIGLNFYPQGQIHGTPTEAGVFALTVEVIDDDSPPQSAQGLVLLTVTPTTIFSFETLQLPPAALNEPYSTIIATNAPANDSVTCFAINGTQESMPKGLILYANCLIQGTPLEAGSYAIVVEATDTQGGFTEQSFRIQVDGPQTEKPSGGCQSVPGPPALAGLVLLALSQVRRRRPVQ